MKIEEIKNIVEKSGYSMSEYFENNSKKILIQSRDGYRWLSLLSDFVSSKDKVLFFHVSNSYTLKNISLWLSINRPEFELLEDNEYEGGHKRLYFYHNSLNCREKFLMSWSNISRGKGCPVCHGLQVGSRKSLAYLFEDLAKEWHSENIVSPEDVTVFSGKKVYWVCSNCGYGKNKEWYSSIANRTNLGRGCPSCSGRIVSDENRLSLLFPDISSEWDYELNKDSPEDVQYGSSKKRWWICKNGHSFSSSINSRTNMNSGCRECADKQKESKIATEIKEWCKKTFNYVDFEYKVFKNPKTNYFLIYDIYIGIPNSTNGVYIEVHGEQHYKFCKNWHITKEGFENSIYRDRIKKEHAEENGSYIEVDTRKIKNIDEFVSYFQENIYSILQEV